jgi:glycosyltransferase involved in cell wall biosynthesis
MGLSQTGPVRVLLLNQVFHPDPQATSQYLSRLAEELVKRGHEVTVLTGRRDYDDPGRQYPARETWRGVRIVRVWNTGLGNGARWRRAADFFTFILSTSLRGLFLRRADLVVALTSPPLISVLGAVLARLWRARFVYWVMDLNPDEAVAVGWLKPEGGMTQILEAVSRWTLRQARRVIVLDSYMRDRLLGKGVAGEKIEVVPLWQQGEAVFDAGKREQFRREHGLENKYVVMYAGNHTPCHPLDTLIEAARLLDDPGVHFAFVGFGVEWGKLRARARAERWKNVSILGFQPLATGLLSAADLQVVVMGEPFVGIIHPCKVYNFLAAQRPFIYIGPERSHVADLIQEAGLERVTASFRHGESRALADELRRRSRADAATPTWPAKDRMVRWSEASILEKIISLMGG